MAHFAQLDENNVVIQVIVVANAEVIGPDGTESEQKGVEFCRSLYGADTRWVQTSYNNKFRCRYAPIDGTYDASRDAFLFPKPYPSYVLNETTLEWDAPVPYPSDGKRYQWDEATLSWIEVYPLKFNL
jgi:hypothetical protein